MTDGTSGRDGAKRQLRRSPPTTLTIETRERLAGVESKVESNADSLDRIEETLEEIQSEVREVDEQALDEEYFRSEYRPDIEHNATVASLLVWGGGVLLALLGMFATLLSSGVLTL